MLSGGPFTVSTLSDSGAGSLRAAITSAESAGGTQTINFTSGLTGTIVLASALPNLTGNLTIDGPGASVITIQGAENNSVFTVNSGQTVLLENLTVTGGGSFSDSGGGVANNGGNVTLQGDVISGNLAQYGGGVFNSGTLAITGTTISGNEADGFLSNSGGGGIDNQGALTIVNSTISGNTCGDFGGAILSTTALSLTDSTVYGNVSLYYSASTGAAGKYTPGGIDAKTSCTLNGTIVAGNTPYDTYGGKFTGSHDLIGNIGYLASGSLTLTASIVGTIISPVSADMDPLGNYGGATPTQALMPDSPAIGQGAVFAAADGVDQRGFARTPGFIDIGAFQSAEAPEPTLTVTNLNDAGTGSLRQAITTANLDYGNQTITFAPSLSGAIMLASPLPGLIANTTIVGPGSSVVSVNGNSHGSVFTISPGGNAQIENVTITGGNGKSGGDIINQSSLTLANCSVSGGAAQYGGGIDNQGSLTLTNSTITGNSASIHGGGIFSTSGSVTVSNSTLSSNSAFAGGAIAATATTVNVSTSTISGNTATFAGGGIYADATYNYVNVFNSTLTGNSAGIKAGAIFNLGKALVVVDSTISGNSAGSGGGIQGQGIIDGNIVAANSGGDLNGTFNGSNDLIGDGSASASLITSLKGSTASPLKPDLGPLAKNGGPTQTEALLTGSPAIGAGATFTQANGVDQRGQPRPGAMGTDIGAYQTELIVNTLGDPSTVTAGTLSLRQAITDANSFGGTTIFFASTLSGTISLNSALPAITGTLTIDGPGPSVITVNGGAHGSIFTIAASGQAVIENLTITDGGNTGINTDGGAILNDGTTLTVVNCDITGNTAGEGGGIYSGGTHGSGTLIVTNSTISKNTGTRFGGGIYSTGPFTVTDSTISGNSTANSGGGIYTDNSTGHITSSTISGNSAYSGGGVESTFTQLTVTNSTFTGNTVTTYGGAIFTAFSVADLSLTDSTISGNKGKTGDGGGIIGYAALYGSIIAANTGGDLLGSFFGNHDLIGDGSDASSLTSSLTGTTAKPLNPLLGPLTSNGGPTPTMALLSGSPAIDSGAAFAAANGVDQRGVARPPSVGIDMGAFQTNQLIVNTLTDPASPVTGLLSLREAIADANSLGGDQTITFASGLSGTITLTDGFLPAINTAMNIDGPGISVINVNGQSLISEFIINPNVTAQIEGITITGDLTPISINGGAAVDIGGGSLAIDYTGSSPIATIESEVASGYQGGQWNGSGIISSFAASNSAYAVGYADGSKDAGTAAAPGQVLLKTTLIGDANLDGTVNLTDLLALLNNYDETGRDWAEGDFNYDGTVNLTDLLALLNNYDLSAQATSTALLSGSSTGLTAGNSIMTPEALASSTESADNAPIATASSEALLDNQTYKTQRTPFATQPLTLNAEGNLVPFGAGDNADSQLLQSGASVL